MAVGAGSNAAVDSSCDNASIARSSIDVTDMNRLRRLTSINTMNRYTAVHKP